MAGFGGTIKLEGAEKFTRDLQNIRAELQKVAAQQKLTSAEYDKSDMSTEAVNARLKNLNNTLELSKKQLTEATDNLKKWRAQQEQNKATIQNVQAQLEKEKTKLAEIAKQYGTNSKEYQAQAKVVANLEKELANLNKQYDKNEITIKKAEAAQTSAQAGITKTEKAIAKLSSEAQDAANKTEDLGDATETAGNKAGNAANGGFTVFKGVLANLATDVIRRATTGLKSMAREMLNAGKDFDSGMSRVSAISGATGESLDKLSAKAKEMGATTKFTATEASDALYYMAMAGWKTEDMLAGLSGVMNLAAASGEGLSRTSDIVTDALTAFKLEAKDATRFADVLAAVSANANTNVDMMGSTFKYVGSVAGTLGYSIEDVAVSIGLMANAGIKSEMAGTALRSTMMRLATDTGKATQAANELGVQVANNDGSMRAWGDVVGDLRKAFAKLTTEEQSNYAKTIAGTEAMNGFLTIMTATETDVNKLSKAIKNSSGAAEDMAKTMQDNVGGKLTLLKSKLETIYLTIWEKLEPSIRKAIDSISKTLDTVDWEDFGRKAGEALEKLAKGFEWILKNKELVVGAITAIVGAMAIKKVTTFATEFASVASKLASFVKPASAASGAPSGVATAASGAATASAGAASSTGLLASAFGALTSPVGLAVAGITALVGVMVASANAIKRSNTELNENMKATEKLEKAQKSFTKTVEENRKAREENIKTANKELEDTDALVYRLETLSKKQEKTVSEKKEIKAIVEKLNSLVPDLALSYNAETDALSENTDKIEANISARKNLNQAEAERTNLTGITEDMTEAEKKLAEAVEQNKKNEDTYLEAKKKREDFEKKYTPQQIANNVALQSELIRLTNLESAAQRNWDKSRKVVGDYQSSIAGLRDDYAKTADAAEDFERRANVAVALEEIAAKAKEAGRKIPVMLAEGMEAGRYAVPKSLEELDRLIEFDSAIQKAGLTGKQIPESISQGLMEGKYSVAEAMRQVKETISLADDMEKIYNEGASIPKNLADGIRSGKVSVDEANEIIRASTDYGQLVDQALKTGAAIPQNLGQGIRDGTITAQEAVQQMKDAIQFSDLSAKASQAGIEIPQFLADQVKNGEVKPKDAVDRMQALIDYRKALDDAGLAGTTIPANFVEGILSGEMNVTDSIATMNGWVQFQKAIENTDLAGKEIPKTLAQNILNGKTSPQNAVVQMNNWIKFQDALKTTDAAGKEVPQKLAELILAGKMKPENAVKELNRLMQQEALKSKKGGEEGGKAFDEGLYSGLTNKQKQQLITGSIAGLGGSMKSTLQNSIDAHSPSRDAARIGGYFLDGVYNGVANQNKRNSIFSSLWNFGSGLLANLRASLQERSPSKATREMGQYLLEGLGLGIKDEENGVLNQVRELGENMLETLDVSLAEGLSAEAFSGLENAIPSDFGVNIGQTTARVAQDAQNANTGLVDQFKQALGEMKIVMDDEEMGKFVDKTVTDLVYN